MLSLNSWMLVLSWILVAGHSSWQRGPQGFLRTRSTESTFVVGSEDPVVAIRVLRWLRFMAGVLGSRRSCHAVARRIFSLMMHRKSIQNGSKLNRCRRILRIEFAEMTKSSVESLVVASQLIGYHLLSKQKARLDIVLVQRKGLRDVIGNTRGSMES